MRFESDVTSDGTQTGYVAPVLPLLFESDVTSDGTQTDTPKGGITMKFESDVTSDGTQTIGGADLSRTSLRVM